MARGHPRQMSTYNYTNMKHTESETNKKYLKKVERERGEQGQYLEDPDVCLYV